jgi:hypothetical protein
VLSVPTETYGNNVGFYGQWFTLDAAPAAAVQGEPDGPVQLDDVLVDVFPQPVLRKRLASVSGRVRAWGGTLRDVLVTFSEVNPAASDKLFDMNWLPRIEKDQLVTTGARYQPTTCGPQTVVVQVIPHDGITRAATGSREILVTTDPVDDTRLMLQSPDELDLGKPVDPQLRSHLQRALQKFEKGQERAGIRALEQFTDVVQRLSEPKPRDKKLHSSFNSIPEDIASTLEYQAQSVIDCMGGVTD